MNYKVRQFINSHRRRYLLEKTSSFGGTDKAVVEPLQKSFNLLTHQQIEEGIDLDVFKRFPHARKRLLKGETCDTVLLMTDLSPFSSAVSS